MLSLDQKLIDPLAGHDHDAVAVAVDLVPRRDTHAAHDDREPAIGPSTHTGRHAVRERRGLFASSTPPGPPWSVCGFQDGRVKRIIEQPMHRWEDSIAVGTGIHLSASGIRPSLGRARDEHVLAALAVVVEGLQTAFAGRASERRASACVRADQVRMSARQRMMRNTARCPLVPAQPF